MEQINFTGYACRPPHLVALHKSFYEREGLEVEYHFVGLAPPWSEKAIESGGNVLARGADYVPDWLKAPENREETLRLLATE